jgi:hypothetical protein
MSTGKAISPGHRPASALDDLLTVEQEIAGILAAAEQEADAVLAKARAEAAAIAGDAELALSIELAHLESQAKAEQLAAAKAIEDEAAISVARYRALDDATILRLAETMAAEVAGLSLEPSP